MRNRPPTGRSISQWGGFIEGIEWVNPALFGVDESEAADVDPLVRLFTETSLAAVADSKSSAPSLQSGCSAAATAARSHQLAGCLVGAAYNLVRIAHQEPTDMAA